MSRTISVKQAIYDENDILAQSIKDSLSSQGIFTINILGGAGAGKTSTLIKIIKLIRIKSYVIEGDIESDIDTKTLQSLGVDAFQINTGGNCHLNATMIQTILPKINFTDKGILFIENIGNLVCPAEFVIGEQIKILICSVPEGSDKPYKYPAAFQRASAVILNKMDLLPYIPFDLDYFDKGIRSLNPDIKLFPVSCATGEGFEPLVSWISDCSSTVLIKSVQ